MLLAVVMALSLTACGSRGTSLSCLKLRRWCPQIL